MFENMTDDFLRERMLSRIPGKMDTRPSSLIYDTHEAAATELAILYIEMEYLVRNSYATIETNSVHHLSVYNCICNKYSAGGLTTIVFQFMGDKI